MSKSFICSEAAVAPTGLKAAIAGGQPQNPKGFDPWFGVGGFNFNKNLFAYAVGISALPKCYLTDHAIGTSYWFCRRGRWLCGWWFGWWRGRRFGRRGWFRRLCRCRFRDKRIGGHGFRRRRFCQDRLQGWGFNG